MRFEKGRLDADCVRSCSDFARAQEAQVCSDSISQVPEDDRVLRREIQSGTALIQRQQISHHLFDHFRDDCRSKPTCGGVQANR